MTTTAGTVSGRFATLSPARPAAARDPSRAAALPATSGLSPRHWIVAGAGLFPFLTTFWQLGASWGYGSGMWQSFGLGLWRGLGHPSGFVAIDYVFLILFIMASGLGIGAAIHTLQRGVARRTVDVRLVVVLALIAGVIFVAYLAVLLRYQYLDLALLLDAAAMAVLIVAATKLGRSSAEGRYGEGSSAVRPTGGGA
jgi:hypothetical protein